MENRHFIFIFLSSRKAARRRNFSPLLRFFCDIIRLDGKLAYIHDFLFNSFFLGKYNQGFNNFPKSKTNSFNSFCEALHYSFPSPKFSIYSSSVENHQLLFHLLELRKSGAAQKFFSPSRIFFCDIIILDGKLAYIYDFLFNSFFLGKYNQTFNNFPKSKTNSFSSFCEALQYFSHRRNFPFILPQWKIAILFSFS